MFLCSIYEYILLEIMRDCKVAGGSLDIKVRTGLRYTHISVYTYVYLFTYAYMFVFMIGRYYYFSGLVLRNILIDLASDV